MKKLLVCLLMTVFIWSCAKAPSRIISTHVPFTRYSRLSCEEIIIQQGRVDLLLAELTKEQQVAAGLDAVLVGAGALLLWPLLIAVPFGPDHEVRISNLKGDVAALQDAYDFNKCQ